MPSIERRSRAIIRTAVFATVVASATAGAQMPGAPILQNVWAAPGIVAAIDLAGGADGSVYAAAAGWTPGSGRFQLSGGLGARNRTGSGSGAVYGVRAAMPFGGAASSFGFAAFAGVGGGGSSRITPPDSVPNTMEIPLGAAVGWRKAIGTTHGISVYGTPSYVLFTGGSKSGGVVRVGLGVDAGITKAIGATLGAEFGASRGRGVGGPSGTLYGLGLSYALGRR